MQRNVFTSARAFRFIFHGEASSPIARAKPPPRNTPESLGGRRFILPTPKADLHAATIGRALRTATVDPVAAGPNTLGIIAGSGRLPLAVAEAAQHDGRSIFVLALEGMTKPEDVSPFPHGWASLGEIGKAIKLLKGAGCSELTMAGKAPAGFSSSSSTPWGSGAAGGIAAAIERRRRAASYNDDHL